MSNKEQAENTLGILGPLIKQERLARGLSLAALAEKIGVSKVSVYRMEEQEQGLSRKKVKHIFEFFGLSDKSIYYIFIVNDIVKHSKSFGYTIDDTFEILCRADIDQLQVTKEELKKLIH